MSDSDRERKLAYMWFCLGYSHGVQAGERSEQYSPNEKFEELTKQEEKYVRKKEATEKD
jgi:hypothetical protein